MSIPWIEKYRPNQFSKIVLSDKTRNMVDYWFKQKKFPNILLYGPPGTGKTTTAWNIIRKYQTEVEKQKCRYPVFTETQNVISLNASDENGVEIIRRCIHEFVKGKNLFQQNKLKFVILDEIDHMTPHAQRMLCFILQEYQHNIRYVLMCNYISYLNNRLRNQVRILPFYGMEKDDIKNYLKNICKKENISINNSYIFNKLFTKYDCDIRSMVNWIQQNADVICDTQIDLDKQFNEFMSSLASLETFIKNLHIQDEPKDYLLSMLYHGYSNGIFEKEAIDKLKRVRWNGEMEITSLTGIGQTNAFTELVVWYYKMKKLKLFKYINHS